MYYTQNNYRLPILRPDGRRAEDAVTKAPRRCRSKAASAGYKFSEGVPPADPLTTGAKGAIRSHRSIRLYDIGAMSIRSIRALLGRGMRNFCSYVSTRRKSSGESKIRDIPLCRWPMSYFCISDRLTFREELKGRWRQR